MRSGRSHGWGATTARRRTLYEARELDVHLRLEGDRIKAGPTENITDELRSAIKANRDDVIKALMIRDAHLYLEGHYAEGADLSALDGWHRVISEAYADADPDVFRYAIRGYTRAGLRAFAQAKKEVAA